MSVTAVSVVPSFVVHHNCEACLAARAWPTKLERNNVAGVVERLQEIWGHCQADGGALQADNEGKRGRRIQ